VQNLTKGSSGRGTWPELLALTHSTLRSIKPRKNVYHVSPNLM
jgi:hypothetical protein